RGAALVSGLVVGALLVGGTVLLAGARNPPPPETADLSFPLLPVPTLPTPSGSARAAARCASTEGCPPPPGRTAPTWSTGATSSTTARTAAPRKNARP